MDCERVQDRFSSFWEKELSPPEERTLKEHLSSCPKCHKEFEQFVKTMQWLRSAGEVEVPEGFLPELHKKLEEKKSAVLGKKVGERGFHLPLSFKLPAQAVAMVAVVFLVLYLTKMIPTEGVRQEETRQTPSSFSVREKPEEGLPPSAPPPQAEPFDRLKASSSIEGPGSKASPVSEGERERAHPGSTRSEFAPPGRGLEELAQKEMKDERSAVETTRETSRPKDFEQARADVPKERQPEEVLGSRVKTEAKKSEVPARYQAVDSKKTARVPSPLPGKIEREHVSQEKPHVASKPPQEFTLRISDRKKVIPLLHDLVKRFGGELVTTQGDLFLASLPTGSFSDFKKALAEISSSSKTDLLVEKQQTAGSLSLEEKAKMEEGDKKSKGPAKRATDTESRTILRILLVEE